MRGTKSFGDHRVFVFGDIRAAGTAEIEDASGVHTRLRACEITCHQAANVFSQRHTEISRTLPGAPLYLTFQRNLTTRALHR
jgi:hypothetical protein